jgi:hypothetical protein
MCVDGVTTYPYTSHKFHPKSLLRGRVRRSVWPQEKVVRSIECEGLRTWSVQAIMLVDVFRMVKN